MMRGRQPTPTQESLIAARHSSLSSISVCISEALLSPVSLLRVPRKAAYGLALVLVPWEHSQMMSSLIVSSGCCTQCPVGLIRLCLILSDSLGRLSYKSKFLKKVLPGDNECHSEHPCVNSSAFSTCLVSVHVSVSYSNTLLTVATNMLSFSWLLSTDFHYEWLSRLELFWFSSHAVTKWSSSQNTGSLRPPREVDHLGYDWRIINMLYHDFVFFAFRPGPILLQGLSTSVSSLNACSAVLNMRDMSSAKSRSVTVFAGTQWLTNFTRVNPSASSLPLMAHRST